MFPLGFPMVKFPRLQYCFEVRVSMLCGYQIWYVLEPCNRGGHFLNLHRRLPQLNDTIEAFMVGSVCCGILSGAWDNVQMQSEDFCSICHLGGDLLCCDTCTAVFHLGCLDPPMKVVPRGKWSCPKCVRSSPFFEFQLSYCFRIDTPQFNTGIFIVALLSRKSGSQSEIGDSLI